MPVQISAIIITYNEELNIGRCLSSLQNIADEIIIVDSFSTDKTEEICKKFHTVFFQNKFINFLDQKNYALSKVSYPYVLTIDADEEVSQELAESIQTIKNNCNHDGYLINRKTSYCGKWIKHAGWYPDRKVLLFNKQSGRFNGSKLHAGVKLQKGASVLKLKGDILHYSYENIHYHIEQINKYSELSANEYYADNKNKTMPYIIIKMILTFLHRYIFKLGILDGYEGFVICMLTSYGNFIRDIKLKELNFRKMN